jgi:starch-binding outer membrane protein, SusD/RagB family
MKLSYKTAFKSVILFLILGCISCTKFVEIEPPRTQLVTASVFSNNTTATSALTSIYSQMVNNSESFNMSLSCGLLSDELTNYSNDPYRHQLYTNAMTSIGTNNVYGCWTNAYSYIYQANAVIEGVQNNNNITPVIGRQLIGEAKFIRAFWLFYITNSFGNAPLVTTTDYNINGTLARSSKTQVYNQIIADLKDAENLLSTNFVDATDTTITSDRSRPNKWAAAALLARAYLYTGNNWDSAEVQSTLVIQNTSLFDLVSNPDSVFLANSSEAIWQLAIPLPAPIGTNTPDGYNYILLGAPSYANADVIISTQLLGSFEPGDKRKTDWIGSFIDNSTVPNTTYYFPYKYKVWQSDTISEYVMVFRLAEQYLIRAEARANEGNTTGALSDLNTVRTRAGLPTYSGATDPTSLSAAILHERQVELFTEWGHRWFDLNRTGNITGVMSSPGNVCQFKGGSWNANWQLFPIPLNELKVDHNLSQNPGY